ncbi:T9SS type A sorting domain-containing protein [candidate division KSB1 bacterium]|nr:T9SS type A sorting domain-containing protein [candidate division KSB1 bacterium]
MRCSVSIFAGIIFLGTVLHLYAQPQQGVVYVSLFMHNEDSALGPFDQAETRDRYSVQRNGLVRFGTMIREQGIPFCWQSDWVFLEGVLRYETADLMALTNGKNLVRWLKEDIGMSIDPHSHEHYGYNYADVAHLIDSLGVEPTDVIGGHIYDPYSEKYQDWERFRSPLQGEKYPEVFWPGRILIGSGTPNHVADPAPSGVWRPRGKYDYWSDDPDGNIVCVGQYTGDVAGVVELVQLYQNGLVSPEKILTASIYVGQSFPSGAIEEYEETVVKPLVEMQERGEIRIVDFVELVEIWESDYDGHAHVYNAPADRPDTLYTTIPSAVAGEEGIFAQICFPEQARYSENGSPVLVHVPGGWNGEGISTARSEWPLNDFIEIRFNFPGSGHPDQRSGGSYDERGENCVRALCDVTRFALGKIADQGGYRLDEYSSILPLYDNVGMVGWSNGGNAALAAAGAFGDELEGLAWIVNYESPIGDGMPTVEAGGGSGEVNPAYDADSGTWAMNLLAYEPTLEIRDSDNPAMVYSGGFYFDRDENETFDREIDFQLFPYLFRGKAYYSCRVAGEAQNRSLLAPIPPLHLPTLVETESFWAFRNGEKWIEQVVQTNPRLMFLVQANETDHVQKAADHPHVLIQYEGFRAAGAYFVRLNPDRFYVELLMGRPLPEASDNDAFALFDHQSIRQGLEPNTIPLNMKMGAAIAELADRTYHNNVDVQIGSSPTGIAEPQKPVGYEFLASYPNPFNPATRIVYRVLEQGEVSLTLYDIGGRRVAVLVDGPMPPGVYEYRFDANQLQRPLSSGTYILQLRAGKTVQMRKILYLK